MKKLLLVLLALTMVLSLVACGETNNDVNNDANNDAVVDNNVEEENDTPAEDINAKSEGVMTYAEYAAAAIDAPVTVECYVQAKQGWWQNEAVVYAQDGEGGYFFYKLPCTEEEYAKLTTGTKIRVSGYKAQWAGEIEVVDCTYEILEGNYVAEPIDVTSLLGTDELVNKQNMLCAFNGLTVAPSTDANGNEVAFLYNWDGSGEEGSDLYFNVTLNGNTYTFCVESYLCGAETDVYKAVKALKVGDTVDLVGFLYWYEGAQPHVTSVTVK